MHISNRALLLPAGKNKVLCLISVRLDIYSYYYLIIAVASGETDDHAIILADSKLSAMTVAPRILF